MLGGVLSDRWRAWLSDQPVCFLQATQQPLSLFVLGRFAMLAGVIS